jgi:hypothetical protein
VDDEHGDEFTGEVWDDGNVRPDIGAKFELGDEPHGDIVGTERFDVVPLSSGLGGWIRESGGEHGLHVYDGNADATGHQWSGVEQHNGERSDDHLDHEHGDEFTGEVWDDGGVRPDIGAKFELGDEPLGDIVGTERFDVVPLSSGFGGWIRESSSEHGLYVHDGGPVVGRRAVCVGPVDRVERRDSLEGICGSLSV